MNEPEQVKEEKPLRGEICLGSTNIKRKKVERDDQQQAMRGQHYAPKGNRAKDRKLPNSQQLVQAGHREPRARAQDPGGPTL